MAQVELIMPKMGESVAEATVIKWLKNIGDTIEVDESVLEIATDKVDSEVPSSVEGVLVKQLFNEDDIVKVGEPVAIIDTDANSIDSLPVTSTTSNITEETIIVEEMVEKAIQESTKISTIDSSKFYSPLVRSIAQQEGLTVAILDSIVGSGKNGRVTKKDILSYLKQQSQPSNKSNVGSTNKPTPAIINEPSKQIASPSIPVMEGDEIIEMDRMRKMIANHMVMSKHVSPHVTSFVEADVTNIVTWRNNIKNDFLKREGEKITFTPIFIEAVVKAIKDFPLINVSVDGTNIIKRKHVNIGMAAALPSGNLIVPVIKGADQKNLMGLTKSVNDLAKRARTNELTPDEISGGTFTLTNVGGFGNLMGTPIINQPQVAILAVGAIVKKPSVIETEYGDVIAIRHKMFCSLSYDHRVVDGSLGGSFLRRFADYLEGFDSNTLL
jgi:2-oxoglutarate dehydrogenase E2 component (dihydrolipoamide succinyltransferase)